MVAAPIKATVPPQQLPPKPRVDAPRREGSPARRNNGRPPAIVSVLISVWIVWHFTAIFLAAMAVPGPTSPLVALIAEHPKSPMLIYLNALYLNQGHSFFAPDVGPCHVVRYYLFDQNNQRIGDGLLPDKDKLWPRLYYHRFLMLADQLEMMGGDGADAHKRQYLEAFARQILRENRGAQSVRVQLLAHYPLPQDFLPLGRAEGYRRYSEEMSKGGPPHRIDAEGYELVSEAAQRRTDLPPETDPTPEPPKQTFSPMPPPNSNLNWQGDRPNVANRWQVGGPRR